MFLRIYGFDTLTKEKMKCVPKSQNIIHLKMKNLEKHCTEELEVDLNGNILINGVTRYGKSVFAQSIANQIEKIDNADIRVYFDVKNDYISKFYRKGCVFMKLLGITKVLLFLIIDFYLLYQTLGIKTASWSIIVVVLGIWIFEYIDVMCNCGISLNKISGYEKIKLTNAYNHLADKIFDVEGKKIGKLRLYIIPDDSARAFSYGLHCIGVTRGLIQNVDDITLCAVLAREVYHKINLNAVFKRIIFMNMVVMMAILSINSIMVSVIIWILFFILCLLKLCGKRYFSYWITSGISKAFKGFFSVIQRVFVFIFKTGIGFFCRYSEYEADKYCAKLGYAQQLRYFIMRFEDRENQQKPRTCTDMLYDTKPLPNKRIVKLEQYMMQFFVG